MEIIGVGVVGAVVVAAFLFAIWPLIRPSEDADDVLPSANGHETREQEVARLLIDRDHAYKSISDIEFDRQMGKLSDEDFAQMMEPARARALAVLRRLEARGVGEGAVPVAVSEREAGQVAGQVAAAAPDADEAYEEEAGTSLDERLEEEILAFRKVKPSGAAPAPKAAAPKPAAPVENSTANFCPSCGAKVSADHNFCASCGSKLR